MNMNRLWLKISGFLVLVIVVAAAAYVLLPAETKPTAESGDKTPQPKVAEGRLKPFADIAQSPTAEPGQGLFYPDEKIAVKYPDNLQPGQEKYVSRNRSRLDQGR